MSIATLIDSIAADAEAYRDTDHHMVATMSPGDVWWQGDCGIQYVRPEPGADVNWRVLGVKCDRLQLAEGDGEGSRHVATAKDGCGVTISTGLFGWLIWAPHGITVEHPVHGDVTLEEPGMYAIRFQRGFESTTSQTIGEARVRRAMD